MKKNTKVVDISKAKESVIWSPLEEIVRKGAREMLQAALEVEVEEFLEKYEFRKDEKGRHLVVRNGYMPERESASQYFRRPYHLVVKGVAHLDEKIIDSVSFTLLGELFVALPVFRIGLPTFVCDVLELNYFFGCQFKKVFFRYTNCN